MIKQLQGHSLVGKGNPLQILGTEHTLQQMHFLTREGLPYAWPLFPWYALPPSFSMLTLPMLLFWAQSPQFAWHSKLSRDTAIFTATLPSLQPLPTLKSYRPTKMAFWALLPRCVGNNSAPKCNSNLILHSCVWFLEALTNFLTHVATKVGNPHDST